MLGAVAAVSLLVGGIGIMNIMLAGVMGIPYLFNRTINLLSFQFSASIDVLFDVRRRWTRVRR